MSPDISRFYMSVYNSHIYCNFHEESLINVNLFLLHKKLSPIKLYIEKDVQAEESNMKLIRKAQCF
jgi:hypothetical protein